MQKNKYILIVVLSAIAGGIVAVLVTKAIPRMMAGMMQNFMTQMEKDGCNPSEM